MVAYATTEDIKLLGIELTAEQESMAEQMLETASAMLRTTARKYGKNIDEMIADLDAGADYALTVRQVVAQAVCRAINAAADTSPAITQGSESALGYSVSYSYLNAGQSIYYLRNELKQLGLLRQQFGALEVYDLGDASTRD